MMGKPETTLHGFWRPRYWLGTKLLMLGMRVLPASRYRSDLNAALWTVGLKVQATIATHQTRPEKTPAERVLQFAQGALKQVVEDLLDDPSDLRQDHELDGGPTPQAAIAYYRQLAIDLGVDFDAVVEKGHPHEIRRLKALESAN